MTAMRETPRPVLAASGRRLRFMLLLSVVLHAATLAIWRPAALRPPQTDVLRRIEVTLAAAPVPAARSATRTVTPAAPRTPAPAVPAGEDPLASPDEGPPGVNEPVVLTHDATTALHNQAPHYPLAARRRGEEGRVVLTVEVRADGSSAEVRLRRSSGHPSLDEAALRAIRRWRFVPAQRGGHAVAARVDIPVVFRLEN